MVAPLDADPDDGLRAASLHLALPTEDRPCPYLEGRVARDLAWFVGALSPAEYQALMDRNFRRSGRVVYRPACASCALCRQLRVPTGSLRPSRSQRRVLRRNRDLDVRAARPRLTEEKAALYRRYLAAQHPGSPQSADVDGLRDFLYTSNTDTLEVEYRDPAGRLAAFSILDRTPTALSSVYHVFSPEDRRRSPGVFSVFAECALAADLGLPWYYLGFWVEGSATMAYKADYRPHEVLVDGDWRRVD